MKRKSNDLANGMGIKNFSSSGPNPEVDNSNDIHGGNYLGRPDYSSQ